MSKTNKIIKAAILSAIAFVIMCFDFFIGFPIMKFDFSDIPAVIGAFALGPIWGVVIELVKNIIHTIFRGTETAYVGGLANFLVGSAFALPAGLYYKYNRTFKGALTGLCIASASLIVFSVVVNYYVLIPLYVHFMKIPLSAILEMAKVDNLFEFLLYVTAPFNLIKAVVIMVLTLILYKRVSPILKL